MTATLEVPALRAGRWQLQGANSRTEFAVRNLGVRTVHGQVPLHEAWVDVDPTGNPASVHAVLNLAGITTGNTRRDTDLRKPTLLNTGQYPTLTFTGEPADPTNTGWSVPGNLEAHGQTTAITLRVEVTAQADTGAVTVCASTELDRRDLGVRAPRLLIGARILITIHATISRPTAPKTSLAL